LVTTREGMLAEIPLIIIIILIFGYFILSKYSP
jgi:hypothetical protein